MVSLLRLIRQHSLHENEEIKMKRKHLPCNIYLKICFHLLSAENKVT